MREREAELARPRSSRSAAANPLTEPGRRSPPVGSTWHMDATGLRRAWNDFFAGAAHTLRARRRA